MYICICNAIKEKHVDSCVNEGVCTAAGLFEKMGCRPQCGRCIPDIAHTLGQMSDTSLATHSQL